MNIHERFQPANGVSFPKSLKWEPPAVIVTASEASTVSSSSPDLWTPLDDNDSQALQQLEAGEISPHDDTNLPATEVKVPRENPKQKQPPRSDNKVVLSGLKDRLLKKLSSPTTKKKIVISRSKAPSPVAPFDDSKKNSDSKRSGGPSKRWLEPSRPDVRKSPKESEPAQKEAKRPPKSPVSESKEPPHRPKVRKESKPEPKRKEKQPRESKPKSPKEATKLERRPKSPKPSRPKALKKRSKSPKDLARVDLSSAPKRRPKSPLPVQKQEPRKSPVTLVTALKDSSAQPLKRAKKTDDGDSANKKKLEVSQQDRDKALELLKLRRIASVAIGTRIEIYWDGEDRYYQGTVMKTRGNKHYIRYDDGDNDWVNLTKEDFRLMGDKKQTVAAEKSGSSSGSAEGDNKGEPKVACGAPSIDLMTDNWVEAGLSKCDSSSDSDTDEEELAGWASKMLGVAPVPVPEDKAKARKASQMESPPEEPPKKKKKKAKKKAREQEAKRRREEARAPTQDEIRAILGEDDTCESGSWVRRSVRQPSKSAISAPRVKMLIDKLKMNDPDMVVLKMKKYCSDPDTPQVVIDHVLDALRENANCQALYIQNFNHGMQDEQVMKLLAILKRASCKIWCLNIGETYKVKRKTWRRFAKGLADTKITHMYASEHTITPLMKELIRTTIRNNRRKHDMHIDPKNLDVIVQCTHCWWNPINAKALQAYVKDVVLDSEAQGLPGSMSGPTLA